MASTKGSRFKRYILLHGDAAYYPAGWSDFAGTFERIHQARAAVEESLKGDKYQWAEIVDTALDPPRVVEEGDTEDGGARWRWSAKEG